MAFKNFYNGKKILVTGHTGFKGSWLSKWLIDLGANVVGISDRIISEPSFFEVLNLSKDMNHNLLDIRDKESLERKITEFKPDIVFHLAAQAIVSKSYQDPVETFDTNVMGSINVLEVLRKMNSNCIAVFITSDKCYDNVEWPWGYRETDALGGKDVYSGSKGAAELAIKSYFHSFFRDSNVLLASARAGNVIGGGDWAKDRIIPDAMRAWSSKNAVRIRSPKATRPWQHVLEPLSGYLNLAQELSENPSLSGHSYNFGPSFNENVTVLELLEYLHYLWPEKIKEPVVVENEIPFHEARLLKLNCDKALMDLKWQSTLNYSETISFVSEWYNTFYFSKNEISHKTSLQLENFTKLANEKKLNWSK